MNPFSIKSMYWHTLVQFSGRVLISATAFFTTLLLARTLGVELFSEFIKVTSYVMLFMTAVDFGLNQIFLKQHPHTYAENFGWFFSFRAVFAFALFLIAILSLFMLKVLNPYVQIQTIIGIFITGTSIICYSVFLSCGAVFQMQRRFFIQALIQFTGAFASLAFVVFGVFSLGKSGVYIGFLGYGLSWVVAAALSVVVLKFSHIGLYGNWDPQAIKRLLLSAAPLGALLFINALMFRADVFLLSIFTPNAQIGAYGLAYKCFELLVSLPTFFMVSLFPDLLRTNNPQSPGMQDLGQIVKKTLWIGGVILVIAWISAPLLQLVKPEYTQAVLYLRLLVLSLPVFFITGPLMWLCILKEKQKKLLWVYGGGLLFNIAANLLFIPVFGAAASAVNTGLTELVVLILGLIIFKI